MRKRLPKLQSSRLTTAQTANQFGCPVGVPAPPAAPIRTGLLHSRPQPTPAIHHLDIIDIKRGKALVSTSTDNPPAIIIILPRSTLRQDTLKSQRPALRQLGFWAVREAASSCFSIAFLRLSPLSSSDPSHTNHSRKQHTYSVHFPSKRLAFIIPSYHQSSLAEPKTLALLFISVPGTYRVGLGMRSLR